MTKKKPNKEHWSDDNLKNKHVPSFHSPLILIKQFGGKKKSYSIRGFVCTERTVPERQGSHSWYQAKRYHLTFDAAFSCFFTTSVRKKTPQTDVQNKKFFF